MKVIFLDIDGVLNSHETVEQMIKDGEQLIVWMIDAGLVKRLNTLIERTNAKVVVSSTWRHDMYNVHFQLEKAGFVGEIIDRTPILHIRRGFEIQQWLDENRHWNIEKFVILDDDCDMEHLHPYHVHTSGEKGLQDYNVEAAVRILT